MIITVEISMYPLTEAYIAPIEDFIQRINTYPELKVLTNSTSTHICGEADLVFDVLKKEITHSFEHLNQGIFVSKILKGALV